MFDSQGLQILMLGWEYPPHISGGLGTACEGLTKALSPLGVSIQFVVPHLYGVEQAPHMRMVNPDPRAAFEPDALTERYQVHAAQSAGPALAQSQGGRSAAAALVEPALETVRIPALLNPYLSPEEYSRLIDQIEERLTTEAGRLSDLDVAPEALRDAAVQEGRASAGAAHYGRNLFGEVLRFADRVAAWAHYRRPHLVHAHDWMTFPAAARVARMHGVPLVAHVHSLEQDRSGHGGNPTIVAIEGAGVRAADYVIAVSHYTARKISELHGVPLDRIAVVHNGVYARPTINAHRREHPRTGPLILFLGRITYQKGPDYFVEAAAKVLEKVPDARFVMAGSGDMLPQMQARVRELGIEAAFDFPGFVRGPEVEHLFSNADVYIMPSVSEPFGISALEAMSYETPVILSRQSGASEILKHALKVDFWDVNKLAAQIVAVLRYPELRRNIIEMAREEVRRVHWEAAAAKVRQVYERVLGGET